MLIFLASIRKICRHPFLISQPANIKTNHYLDFFMKKITHTIELFRQKRHMTGGIRRSTFNMANEY